MKQEVIQDFLNLPGIVGVALMDGRSRPYFCGVDQTLNFQQKEALAQGILQVVETIPSGFEAFQFQFTGYQVHIYKLAHGIILLVLTQKDLVYADYLKTIKDLKVALQEDIATAIASFRSVAGNFLSQRISYYKPDVSPPLIAAPVSAASTTASKVTHSVANSVKTSEVTIAPLAQPTSVRPPVPPIPPPAPPTPPPAPPPTVAPVPLAPLIAAPPTAPPAASVTLPAPSPAAAPLSVTLPEVLAALNGLNEFTTHYLGRHVIVNYWKSTRPNHAWLDQFQIDRTAHITVSDSPLSTPLAPLTLQEQQWVQEWIAAFLERCAQVVREFPALVERETFAEVHKKILLGQRPEPPQPGNSEA